MILIQTALKAEAVPIIKKLGLKHKNAPFQVYEGENFVLLVGGVGKLKAATAEGWAFGRYNITGAVNLGVAGSFDKNIKRGEVRVANIVTSDGKKRVFIPDIGYKHSFEECKLITFDDVVRAHDEARNTLCDMEGYGFASSAFGFLQNDKVALLKIVSDNIEDVPNVTADSVTKVIEDNSDKICSFLNDFAAYCKPKESESKGTLDEIETKIAEKYRLTESQRHILKKELNNTLVFYSAYPDVEKIPPLEGNEKKHIRSAFEVLIDNIRSGKGLTDINFTKPDKENNFSLFRRIYVEREALNEPYTKNVLGKFKRSQIIEIPDYKAFFSVKKQNVSAQMQNKSLILAKAKGNLVYEGSDYCNAFGFDRFYYCSTVMGCIYNCEYCYLQGMYPSANVVAFVNIDDYFKELDKLDNGKEALVCLSYDSDIAALDKVLDTVGKWCEYARSKPHMTFEIRTKSANISAYKDIKPLPNVIVAYTLSPESVRQNYEKRTSALKMRLSSAAKLCDKGWRVRLSVEPILAPVVPVDDYYSLMDNIAEFAKKHAVEDVVLGEFRMNCNYFSLIRAQLNNSRLFANPYIVEDKENGVSYRGADKIKDELYKYLSDKINVKIVCFGKDK